MEGRYRQYFEEAPCYMTIHDREFRIIDGNRRFRDDFGDGLGKLCYTVYKRRQEVCPDCPVDMTFQNGVPQVSEQTLTTREGEELPVRVRTMPIRDESGAIVSVMEMHTDLRESKRLARELHHSRERLAQLFEEVPCFISVQGPDRVIQHTNRKFRETFGEGVGEPCYKVYKHRDEPCLVCTSQNAFDDGTIHEHEEVVVTAGGDKINVLCVSAPVRNESGKVEAVIEMSTDITQLRQLQSQLTSIGLLVGSISHGIKGLLTGLDGGIYMVNSGFSRDNPERVRKGWEMVQRNVDRIRSMVLDILYYAKDRELLVEPIDAGEMATEVREILEKKASELDVSFVVDIGEGVGTMEGDAKAIRAMLVNIVENSLEACRSDPNKESHHVTFSIRREPPWMTFEVQDNGIGMDRETRDKVFSLFFSSKGIKGTGLGLFIANKIADKHGGAIEVASEPGAGARFTARLPLRARPSTQPPEALLQASEARQEAP